MTLDDGKVMEKKSTIGKVAGYFFRLGLAALIIGALIYFHYDEFVSGLKKFNYLFLVLAGAAYLSHMVVSAYRWRELTKVIGLHLRFREALSLTMQSYFFSLVIPGGAIGGDVAKASVVALRTTKGRRMEGVFTILMDRIVGMAALFIMAIVLTAFSIPLLMNVEILGYQLNDGVKICGICAIFLLCFSGLAATLVLFFHRQFGKIRFIAFLMRLGDKYCGNMVTRLCATMDLYSKKIGTLLYLTVISVFFIHGVTVLTVILLIYGLDVTEFDYLTVFTAVTLGNIVGLIPLTVSGIGLRDYSMKVLLSSGLVGNAELIPVLYSLVIVLCNLLGGLFFIWDPGRGRELKMEMPQ